MRLLIVRCFAAVAILVGGVCGLALSADAQASASGAKQGNRSRGAHKAPATYEDREIKVVIPAGWSVVKGSGGNSIGEGPGVLVLEKKGYTLSLAYHTGQASGIVGGRFIEIFDIPWPGIDDAWTCSGYLQQITWPAGRNLMFVNVIVDTGDPRVRENCAMPKLPETWVEKDGQKQFDFGERRWFGGYFTAEEGGYFFGGDGDGCGEKAYTLTSRETTPGRLPIADIPSQGNNPELEKTIQESIDIVNSIRYKRCAPF